MGNIKQEHPADIDTSGHKHHPFTDENVVGFLLATVGGISLPFVKGSRLKRSV